MSKYSRKSGCLGDGIWNVATNKFSGILRLSNWISAICDACLPILTCFMPATKIYGMVMTQVVLILTNLHQLGCHENLGLQYVIIFG